MFCGKRQFPNSIIRLDTTWFKRQDAQQDIYKNGYCSIEPRCPFFRDHVDAETLITFLCHLRIAALVEDIPLLGVALSGIIGYLVAFLHVIGRRTVYRVKFPRV